MSQEPHPRTKGQFVPADEPSHQLVSTAYHEAGHAVMALALGRDVQKVTVRPGRSQLGEVRLGTCELGKSRNGATRNSLEDEVLILFAGMVAEARFSGKYCQTAASQDLRTIRQILQSRVASTKQIERLEKRLLSKTEHVLHDEGHVTAIEWIAKELVQRVTISGRSVRHYYKQAMQRAS